MYADYIIFLLIIRPFWFLKPSSAYFDSSLKVFTDFLPFTLFLFNILKFDYKDFFWLGSSAFYLTMFQAANMENCFR